MKSMKDVSPTKENTPSNTVLEAQQHKTDEKLTEKTFSLPESQAELIEEKASEKDITETQALSYILTSYEENQRLLKEVANHSEEIDNLKQFQDWDATTEDIAAGLMELGLMAAEATQQDVLDTKIKVAKQLGLEEKEREILVDQVNYSVSTYEEEIQGKSLEKLRAAYELIYGVEI